MVRQVHAGNSSKNCKRNIPYIINKTLMQLPLKIILLSYCLIWNLSAIAQNQDPWIGTWTSESYKALDCESERQDYTYFRYVIKISKNGDNYLVRAKTVKVADPQSAIYNDACGIKQIVKEIVGNSMFLESRRERIPFYVNGQLDSYSNTTSYFKLTIDNDVLHCSLYKYEMESYDKNMMYEYTTTYGLNEQYIGPCFERVLFNDDW